jgi:hypothetical protein
VADDEFLMQRPRRPRHELVLFELALFPRLSLLLPTSSGFGGQARISRIIAELFGIAMKCVAFLMKITFINAS